jgi:ABC-type multidrug transport system permease subunit
MGLSRLGRGVEVYTRLITSGFGNAMRQYLSFRTQSAMRILGTIMEVAVWGLLGSLLSNPALQDSLLEYYGTPDMATFMLSGLIISKLVDTAQIISPGFFRRGYTIYHNRPFNMWVVAMAEALDVRFFWNVVSLIIYVLFAILVFHIQINFLSTGFWVVIFLGALFRFGLGLFTAGWTLVTKNTEDPINWFYSNTSRLLTGELIPVHIISGLSTIGPALGALSMIHPKTYVQTLGRKTAVGGSTLLEILPDLWAPLLAGVFFLGLGFLTLRWGIKRAKREGTLRWG